MYSYALANPQSIIDFTGQCDNFCENESSFTVIKENILIFSILTSAKFSKKNYYCHKKEK